MGLVQKSALLRQLLLSLAMLAMSGCIVVGPDHEPPCVCAPDYWHQQLQNGHHVSIDELREWWWLFNDPVMGELIECSKQRNLGLYAALTRICQARAQVCVSESDLFGTVNGNAGWQEQRFAPNGQPFGAAFGLSTLALWSLGFDTAWEANLFGHVTRRIELAEANLGSNIEAYRDVMVTLLSDVAQNYVQLRTAQEQLRFARRNVKIQQDALELAKKRVEGGIAPILDQYQAESNLAGTEAEIPPLELQIHQTLNRLAVLLGEFPGALHCRLAEPAPIPSPPECLPVAIPCDIIRQRPDIRQAERQLAARTAELGIAVAELFPRLRFNGSFGLQSQDLSKLFTADSFQYTIGPSVSWPIFQAGRLLCSIESSEAAAEETYVLYEQTVLQAIEEVENAIVGYNKEVARRDLLKKTVEAAEKSLQSVLELYRSGKTNFQNVLDSLRTLFTAQNSLAASEGQVVQQLISFYRALGGGYDPDHHCGMRCVRLGCPERCDADLVEQLTPAGDDVTSQYESREEDSEEDDDPADEDESDLERRDDLDEDLERLPDLGDSDADTSYEIDSFFERSRSLDLKPD